MARSADEIEALIEKLGASSFPERKKASDTLRMIGLPARGALEKAVLSDDPEIKLRAGEILRDIKYGIHPTWPEETRSKIRDFDQLDRPEKQRLMERLVDKHGEEAIPFLLMRVEKGKSTDADLALAEQGKEDEAGATVKRALSLNPDKEDAHYTAAEMLLDMGELRLSEKEWKKILEISPADDVYDLNAYMRLGSIYARRQMYAEAVEMLETGKKKYKKAKEKHGRSMGMIGADQLDVNIARYKEMARQAEKIKTYEKDYVLSLQAGKKILARDRSAITINGKKYRWKELGRGIPYDYLPERLEIEINGATPEGEKMNFKHSFDPSEFIKESGKIDHPTVIKLSIGQK